MINTLTLSLCNSRQPRVRRLLAAALLTAGAAAALAWAGDAQAHGNGLRIESGQPLRDAGDAGDADAGRFLLANAGHTRLARVQLFASPGQVLACDGRTVQGREFPATPAAVLEAGDAVACLSQPASGRPPAGASAGAVVAVARDGDAWQVERRSLAVLGGAGTPDQGIIALLSGSQHNDGNSNGQWDVGESIDYHYTLVNLGTQALSSLVVADQGGAVTCPATSLAVGADMVCSTSYTLDAADVAAGLLVNEVEVLGQAADGSPVQAADVLVRQSMDGSAALAVFKSPMLLDDADGSGYASVGDLLQYTFAVKNAGVQALYQVDLVEPDPSLIDTPISCAGQSLSGAPFAGLGTGELASFDVVLCTAQYTITAADAAYGQALNLVEAHAQPGFGPPVYATGASAVVIPLPPEVLLTKALIEESGSRPGIAEPGETLTYRITLANAGTIDAFNIGISDQLDANTSFIDASHGGSHAAGVVTWSGLTVPANGQLQLQVRVQVADPLPPSTLQVANLAWETGTTPPPCPPAGEQCVVTPTPAAVAISKALVAEDGAVDKLAEPGELLTYAITLTNSGGSPAQDYALVDVLDANTVFVSASDGGVHSAGVVNWNGLTVPANGSLVVTVQVRVADPLPVGTTQVANLAYQAGTTPPPCPPAGEQCVITPTPGTVSLVKTVSDDNGNGLAEPGEQLTYSIVLTNNDDQPAINIDLVDVIDANTLFVSADHGGSFAGGAITWTGLTVPANSQLVLTVVVQVVDPIPAGVTNISNLVHDAGGPPPDCGANPDADGCAEIPVGAGPLLAVAKSVDPAEAHPGDSVLYTVTVANVGSVPVTGVRISDPLPAGVVSFAWQCQGSAGATCPAGTGTGAIDELVPLLPVGGSLTYSVLAELDGDVLGEVLNIVTVSPDDRVRCAPDNSPSPCQQDAPVRVRPELPTYIPVPATDRWALAIMVLGLLGLGLVTGRRRLRL